MKIVNKKIEEIIPYETNPRVNDHAVEFVANSIKEFGFKVPIIITSDNIIVAGHTRIKAAQLLGMKEVPVIIADDLTDDQIKAFRLADNKTAEIAEWDFGKLYQELDELSKVNLDFDMTDFGFTLTDFQNNDVNDEPKEVDLVDSDVLIVKCASEIELEMLYDELKERGYECHVSTS